MGVIRATPPAAIAAGPVRLEIHGPERAAEVADAINASLEHLRPWMAWARRPTNAQEQAMRLAMAIEQAANGGDVAWSIVDPAGRIVGACGLHHRSDDETLDVGYWLADGATGRGYATHAAAALTATAFDVFGKERVRITCDETNARSAAVPARLRYRYTGTVDRAGDEPGRTMVWVMDRAAWPASPGSAIAVSYI